MTFERSKSLKIKRRRLSPGKSRNTHLAETVETRKAEVAEAMEYPKFSFRIAPEIATRLVEEATNRKLGQEREHRALQYHTRAVSSRRIGFSVGHRDYWLLEDACARSRALWDQCQRRLPRPD